MNDNVVATDVLVIGAGLAGERTAIEVASRGLRVIILSLVPPRRSHSTAAQGGMQAALGNMLMGQGDSPDVHFQDTVRGADWGCEQDVARLFVNLAPIACGRCPTWGFHGAGLSKAPGNWPMVELSKRLKRKRG